MSNPELPPDIIRILKKLTINSSLKTKKSPSPDFDKIKKDIKYSTISKKHLQLFKEKYTFKTKKSAAYILNFLSKTFNKTTLQEINDIPGIKKFIFYILNQYDINDPIIENYGYAINNCIQNRFDYIENVDYHEKVNNKINKCILEDAVESNNSARSASASSVNDYNFNVSQKKINIWTSSWDIQTLLLILNNDDAIISVISHNIDFDYNSTLSKFIDDLASIEFPVKWSEGL
jgi:hypothetical protein